MWGQGYVSLKCELVLSLVRLFTNSPAYSCSMFFPANCPTPMSFPFNVPDEFLSSHGCREKGILMHICWECKLLPLLYTTVWKFLKKYYSMIQLSWFWEFIQTMTTLIWKKAYMCAPSHKKGWTPKNWCFWIMVLENTLENPLDSKEIKPVNLKGNQSWMFTGRTDAEAEAPILWPPDAKSWLIGKDPDAGKEWRQKKKGAAEDEMVRWHHHLNRHEFEQSLGDIGGQRSLACCSPCGRNLATEQQQQGQMKTLTWKNMCTLRFTEALFTIAKIWKQRK